MNDKIAWCFYYRNVDYTAKRDFHVTQSLTNHVFTGSKNCWPSFFYFSKTFAGKAFQRIVLSLSMRKQSIKWFATNKNPIYFYIRILSGRRISLQTKADSAHQQLPAQTKKTVRTKVFRLLFK